MNRKDCMPDLQDKLDAITQRTRALVQADRLAVSERSTAELFHSGIEGSILPVGAIAPEFALTDAATGDPIRSSDLLGLGPLVLNFFRGRWCPYCITELETWRDLYPELRRRGALLAAISPQTSKQNAFTATQLAGGSATLPFPILSDPDAGLAAQFGIAYTVPAADRRYFRSILVNIPLANSGKSYDTGVEGSWRLPLPATFVIAPDRRVLFAEAHADFRVRPEPAAVLEALAAV